MKNIEFFSSGLTDPYEFTFPYPSSLKYPEGDVFKPLVIA